jgi:hypothetical protein
MVKFISCGRDLVGSRVVGKRKGALRDFGGGAGGFGAGEGEESGGHGAARRGKFGHGGGGWWTPERQKHAYDRLRAGGLSDMGAKGLISRWVYVEAPGGPTAENAIGGGHYGIGQWSHSRGNSIWGSSDFDAQLDLAIKETKSNEALAGKLLQDAQTKEEGARAATAFERAEHYNAATHIDDHTNKTLAGIDRVERAIRGIGEARESEKTRDKGVIPGQGDPHKPGFDPSSIKFHDYFPEKHSNLFPPDLHHRLASLLGKPLGHHLRAQNEIHDHRSVINDVNINVVGASPVERTERPLGRPKNADIIRNTASYAA